MSEEVKNSYQDKGREFEDKVIKMVETQTAPWQKPWDGSLIDTTPMNFHTGKHYRGLNILALYLDGQSKAPLENRWMTYKQAKENDLQVQKGAKSSLIECWIWDKKEAKLDNNGNPLLDSKGKEIKENVPLSRPMLRYYHVFQATDVRMSNGQEIPPLPLPERSWSPIEMGEKILKASGAEIIHDQADKAFYSPTKDQIHLPVEGTFPDSASYYSSALHELSHWSGHKSRLNRNLGEKGSDDYAKEELRAEICSWMISMELGLPHDPSSHASYLKAWSKILKEDPKEIKKACKDADQMKEYVLSLGRDLDKSADQAKVQANDPVNDSAKDKSDSADFQNVNTEGQNKEPSDDLESRTPRPTKKENRIYLKVPYEERFAAKELGAKWDKYIKSWYAPEGTDIEPLKKWVDKRSEKTIEKENSKNPNEGKIFLVVPFKEHLEAKALGAKWDNNNKLWFVAKGVDIKPLEKWLPKTNLLIVPGNSPAMEFKETLNRYGLITQGAPVMDGSTVRCSVAGSDPAAKYGSYSASLESEDRASGWLKNHKTGQSEQWIYTGQTVSQSEREAFLIESEERKANYSASQTGPNKLESLVEENSLAGNLSDNFTGETLRKSPLLKEKMSLATVGKKSASMEI